MKFPSPSIRNAAPVFPTFILFTSSMISFVDMSVPTTPLGLEVSIGFTPSLIVTTIKPSDELL